MKLLSLFFTNLLAFLLVTRVREVVALILVGAVAFTIVAPPAKARRDNLKSPLIGENLDQGCRLQPRQFEDRNGRRNQRGRHGHAEKLGQLQREHMKGQAPAERLHVHDSDQAPGD